MSSLWLALQLIMLAFAGVVLANVLSNLRILRRLGDARMPAHLPRVSILVPARNEEANIARCVRSLLDQEYPDYEVLVLDDNSEDRTRPILAALAADDPRLRVLAGRPLPGGWQGKNWACHQLAQAAQGELLLFTDADTRHHPAALGAAVATLSAQNADFLTAFPRQEVGSWSERLLVPVLTWSFVLFLPLGLAYRSPRPDLSIAIGQYMLFRRRAYDDIGGHQAVRHDMIDDMALARRIKEHGLRWRLADGSAHVRCRMYRGLRDTFQGLSKSLFPGFGYRVLPFVVALAWGALLICQPLAVVLLRLGGVALPRLAVGLAAATAGLSLLITAVCYPRFDFPRYLALLYPLTALTIVAVALCSFALALVGRYRWKGRRPPPTPIRWR